MPPASTTPHPIDTDPFATDRRANQRPTFQIQSTMTFAEMKEAIDSFNQTAKTALKLDGTAPTAATDCLNVGIIGCGRIGQTHAANICNKVPTARLVCVSDVFESAALKCAAAFDVPTACKDAADLIANPMVQAVIVCSPTDTHADIIRAAAAARKHIFCEKPVDKTLAVIDDLARIVAESGVKFFLGFQRRFDVHFQRAQAALTSGAVGQPLKVHLVSRDPAPPPIGYLKQAGGLFLDMSSHDFDMARFLTGSDISEITAIGIAHDKDIAAVPDVDQTICTVRFENDAIGIIDNSRSSALGYDQRAELFGTLGSSFVGNVVPNTGSQTDKDGEHTDSPLNFFMERYADAYVNEMKAFVDVVVNDKPVPCGIEDGRKTVIYAAAAELSIKEKRTVKVSEISAEPKARY